MTWAQFCYHTKLTVFAKISDFWDPMPELIRRHMHYQGFIHRLHLLNPLVIDNVKHNIVPSVIEGALVQ